MNALERIPVSESKNSLRLTRRGKLARVAFIAAGAVAAVKGGQELFDAADYRTVYSAETTASVAEQGDGLLDLIYRDVDNIDAVDARDVVEYVKDLPVNHEALSDGLQWGESIQVPVRVDKD